jgi:hypothetical protein
VILVDVAKTPQRYRFSFSFLLLPAMTYGSAGEKMDGGEARRDVATRYISFPNSGISL